MRSTINNLILIVKAGLLSCFNPGVSNKSRRLLLSAFAAAPFLQLTIKRASATEVSSGTTENLQPAGVDLRTDHYSKDGYENLNVVRVDLKTFTQPGVCSVDDLSGCTLADVNNDETNKDELTVEIPVAFSAEDFDAKSDAPNASLRQRGESVRLAPQKSYRVKLDSKKTLWRRERRLQLNKHPYDASRIRNKLAFDLMQGISHLQSLRTQFVNVWINDGDGPVDYGLFTHVEHVGREYVRNRGINKDDNIYKVEFINFSKDDLKKLRVDTDGKPLDKREFESRLEIKRGKNHHAVYKMVKAVSDYDQPFEDVFNRFFDANNVITWVTTNFLILQRDAVRRNFYLHNPVNTEKFYILPWDYDRSFEPEKIPKDSFDTFELFRRLTYGYSRGTFSVFLNRYYRMDGIHNAILAKANELRAESLSDARIDSLVDSLSEVVSPFRSRLPDAPISKNVAMDKKLFSRLVGYAHTQLQWQFGIPLPPTLNEPLVDSENVTLSWKPAHDVTQSGPVTYDIYISSSVDFDENRPEFAAEGILGEKKTILRSELPPGNLYVRLVARSSVHPERNWQTADNRLRDSGRNYLGMVVLDNTG